MDKPRYIDANKIVLVSDSFKDEYGDSLVRLRDVRKAIAQTPVEEVTPVIHATWAWITDDDVMCTACGEINNTDDNADAGLDIWKFCPKCGAKMDKGKNEQKHNST